MLERNRAERKLVGGHAFILLSVVIMLLAAVSLYTFSYAVETNQRQNDGIRPANTDSTRPANTYEIASAPSAAFVKSAEQNEISYRGVSFAYSNSSALKIEAETKPASVLEYETDTGQGVAPEHIVFKFVGNYASQHESSFFSPEITIYPIAEYKKALSKSESYVRQFEDEIQTLRAILTRQPKSWNKEMPFLPFEVGASQRFHARTKYVTFQNGRGVWFLTQYNIEPALINNQGLTYTFQGLTDDGIYYVSATFPVSTPRLPRSYEAESNEYYTLKPPRNIQEYKAFEDDYKSYLSKVRDELETLPPDGYQPNLTLFENLIQSLNVRVD